ncbi:MAG: type II secretion system F family protein [Lentisphaeria bacterium]
MSVLKERIEFYHTMTTLLEAGIPLSRTLNHRFQGRFRRAAASLAGHIAAGATLYQAMQCVSLFSRFECSLTSAGESTGRLPDVFHTLEEWFEQNLRLRNKIRSGLLYPIFLYLTSICILAVIDRFTSDKTPALIVAETLVRLLAPFLLYFLGKRLAGFLFHRALMGHLLDCLPILGALQHQQETGRFFKAFGLALSSGLSMEQSIQLSADCCRNQAFRNRYLRLKEILQRTRCPFSEAFEQIQTRRDLAAAIPEMLQTGEQSGNLDVYANRISRLLNDEAALLLDKISKLLPLFIYLLMVVFIAMKIINLARDYVETLNNLM